MPAGAGLGPALLSVGYEGRDVEELVTLLVEEQVTVLLDVRLNAISRKRGFSKTRLGEALADAGITYRHSRSLGNPQDNREPFRAGDTSRGLAGFRGVLTSEDAVEEIDRLVGLLAERRVAVLCFEREHARCHRQAVVDAAAGRHDDLPVRILD